MAQSLIPHSFCLTSYSEARPGLASFNECDVRGSVTQSLYLRHAGRGRQTWDICQETVGEKTDSGHYFSTNEWPGHLVHKISRGLKLAPTVTIVNLGRIPSWYQV